MLVENEALLRVASKIVCLSVEKWLCFERRLAAAAKRQSYLPYMIEMWREHVTRFDQFLSQPEWASRTLFLSPEACHAICLLPKTKADGTAVSVAEACQTLFGQAVASSDAFRTELHTARARPPPSREQPLIEVNAVGTDASLLGVKVERYLHGATADERRIVGCLFAMYLGVALGDAGGAPFEFHRGKPFEWRDGRLTVPLVLSGRGGVRAAPPGAITDDFQMTLLALRTLIKNDMRFVPRAHVAEYIRWASAHPGGIGTNTRALFQHGGTDATRLRKYDEAHAAAQLVDEARKSRSNGTLMRASAFVAIAERERALAAAVGDAALSNDNHTNRYANALYVAILHDVVYRHANVALSMLDELLTSEYLDACERCALAGRPATSTSVAEGRWVRAVALHAIHSQRYVVDGPFDGDMSSFVNSIDKKGYVLVALWVALRYATAPWRRASLTFGETLRTVVNLGGDTDTNAAITGALLGAALGLADLRAHEAANLDVLMNVPYRFSTVKNVDNLTPASLRDAFAELVAPRVQPAKRAAAADDDDDDATESFDPTELKRQKKK